MRITVLGKSSDLCVQRNHLRPASGQAAGAYPLLIIRVRKRYSNHHVAGLARSALPRRDGTKHLILRAGHPCRTASYGPSVMSAINTGDASRRRGPPDLGICLVLGYAGFCLLTNRSRLERQKAPRQRWRLLLSRQIYALSFSRRNAVTTALSFSSIGTFMEIKITCSSRNASGLLSYLPSRRLAFLTSQYLHD